MSQGAGWSTQDTDKTERGAAAGGQGVETEASQTVQDEGQGDADPA